VIVRVALSGSLLKFFLQTRRRAGRLFYLIDQLMAPKAGHSRQRSIFKKKVAAALSLTA
jgi:hypothetical protein